MAGYCTVQAVRDYIFDRSIEDNELLGDLEFSDSEIWQAMQRAARNFNSAAPFSMFMEFNQMPLDTNLPLLMTVEELYKSKLHQLMRNMTSYQAGGVLVDEDKVRAENFRALVKSLREEWLSIAVPIKHAANVRTFLGQVG